MPRAAIGVGLRIGLRGQRLMYLLPVERIRRPVHRRSHQGMPEACAGAELDQARILGRPGGVAVDPEAPARAPDQRGVADRLGGGRQQQALRIARQRLHAPHEALLDAVPHRPRVQQPEPARQLRRRRPARQLQQRERVAVGLGDQPVAHPVIQPAGNAGRQQLPRVGVGERPDGQLRQVGQRALLLGRADGEDHRDPLRQQAPPDERQRLGGGLVEPLRVIEYADQRSVLGDLGQQAERRQRHEKALRRRAVLQTERDLQRVPLRARQASELTEHRRAQLVQPGERKLHLGLDARGAGDATALRVLEHVLEQRRLADPRLAAQDQDPALPRPRIRHQALQRLARLAPTRQPRPVAALGHDRADLSRSPRAA